MYLQEQFEERWQERDIPNVRIVKEVSLRELDKGGEMSTQKNIWISQLITGGNRCVLIIIYLRFFKEVLHDRLDALRSAVMSTAYNLPSAVDMVLSLCTVSLVVIGRLHWFFYKIVGGLVW